MEGESIYIIRKLPFQTDIETILHKLDKKDEEIEVFRGNDHAGWKQPAKPSKFPIVRKEV